MSFVLKVEDLRTYFKTDRGIVKAVDGVSYSIKKGEIVGLIGESGCGKSVSQLSLLRLIPCPPGEIVSGKVLFGDCDLLQLPANSRKMRSIRGKEISMIFQEPMTSLNPALTIKRQLTEMMELHLKLGKQEAKARSIELLRMVGIPDPEQRINDYPHQFSGGMRQRVMIAMALSCNPKLIIADEPTTALDVTIQAQLLELMIDLVKRFQTSLVFVTHNLGIVARYAHRVNIMYAGRIVESGTVKEIWSRPLHPYTIGLLECLPKLQENSEKKKLVPIRGTPPTLINMPPHCPFLPRCRYKIAKCETAPWSNLEHVEGDHYVACHVDISGRRGNDG